MTSSAAETVCRVMVFARAPTPGEAKTRLIPALGAAGAAALHLGDPFFLECERRLGASLHPQGEGDLSARMQRAFESALARSRRAILVGSDIPVLSARYLRDADQALGRGDEIVIGPAEDGGYVLIGLSRCDPELFRDIPWGGSEVLAETRRRIAALGWRVTELPALWDVDRPEDLERLPEEMRESFMPAASGTGARNESGTPRNRGGLP